VPPWVKRSTLEVLSGSLPQSVKSSFRADPEPRGFRIQLRFFPAKVHQDEVLVHRFDATGPLSQTSRGSATAPGKIDREHAACTGDIRHADIAPVGASGSLRDRQSETKSGVR
jgi:hypothetical protein